jgi:predicted metalloprotease with PDZ domain
MFATLCGAILSTSAVAECATPTSSKRSLVADGRRVSAGIIEVKVDATDLEHRVVKVRETIPAHGSSEIRLQFPKWTVGDHAPNGLVDRLTNLAIATGGERLEWTRDPLDPFTFQVIVPANAERLDVSYEIVTSLNADEGPVLMTSDMLDLQWPNITLYPSEPESGDLQYRADLKLPEGWSFASAMHGTQRGSQISFDPLPLNALGDSPVMAGRYLKTISLAEGAHPVRLDLAAAAPDDLVPPDGLVEGYRRFVAEAAALFGPAPFDHYDLMVWLSGDLGPVYYEHHRSGESNLPLSVWKAWNSRPDVRSLWGHDYVHAWNAMLRRPSGMATASFNAPQTTDMLWVTEGLTEYWRKVLGVRAGLNSSQDYLDSIGDLAAQVSTSAGARWRPLRDVGADAIVSSSKPKPWPDWQRDESDDYGQGLLIWLEVDALIRERTANRHSLDDFAKAFFGARPGLPPTYDLSDITTALNQIVPYDWAGFFRERVDEVDPTPGLTGLENAGYRLIFTGEPSTTQSTAEAKRGAPILRYSIGLTVDSKGKILAVAWDSPAWRAGLVVGGVITEVNHTPYSSEAIKGATRLAGGTLALSTKSGAVTRTNVLCWSGGLRYPHLERLARRPALLDDALQARLQR